MTKTLSVATVLGAIALLLGAGPARPGAFDAPWFKTQGGWAYCTHPGYPKPARFLCWSTVTGRWIRVDGKAITTGHDPKYIGFNRRGTDTVTGLWYDDYRFDDSWAVCSGNRRYLRCAFGPPWRTRFWLKQDGTYRIVR